ncbi:CidA/LrgA family protein [Seohaeicola saemankumensis]|uniref:CidA/LrgA family protein n=1 Tax=Seohaeicola saemankumensis TaxID=481181 RepID=A0ABW3TJ42_9RHOB
MTRSAAIVLLLLILGDSVAEGLSLPVPGSALGLMALSIAFAMRGGPDKASSELFDFATPYFPLFFVPAAVGVVVSADMISANWVYIVTAIALSTAATLLISGLVFQALMRVLPSRVET